MFAHTTTIWFVSCPDPAEQLRRGPVPDPDRTDDFIARAYRGATPSAVGAAPLGHLPAAIGDRVFAAHYGDLAVLAGHSLTTHSPAELTEFVTSLEPGWTVLLLSLDPLTSTGTFARWEDGRLQRAFSADPVTIRTDDGVPYPFESPFWSGEHPLEYLPGVDPDPLALPFHPAELAEEANRQWLGFRFTPPHSDGDTDVARVPVYEYEILAAGGTPVRAADVPPLELPEVAPVESESGPAAVPVAAPVSTPAASTEMPPETSGDPAVSEPPADAEVTAPVPVGAPVPATAAPNAGDDADGPRKPGPISRYFGFRGRL